MTNLASLKFEGDIRPEIAFELGFTNFSGQRDINDLGGQIAGFMGEHNFRNRSLVMSCIYFFNKFNIWAFLSGKEETTGCIEAARKRFARIGGGAQRDNVPVEERHESAISQRNIGIEYHTYKQEVDLQHEIKTIVRPAIAHYHDKKGTRREKIILVALHTTADRNIITDVGSLNEIVNQSVHSAERNGAKIEILSDKEIQKRRLSDFIENKLGLKKGEMNPLSLILAAEKADIPLLQVADERLMATKYLTTNMANRRLSITIEHPTQYFAAVNRYANHSELQKGNSELLLPRAFVTSADISFQPKGLPENGWEEEITAAPATHSKHLDARARRTLELMQKDGRLRL